MTEMVVPKTFANNFWGQDDAGYGVLTHKMSAAKKTCEDLKLLYSTKASLHEEIGRKLMKQAKLELGREEVGTLQALLASARKELEIEAQAHLELAQKIRINLELSLENFILEQKDRRKLIQANVDKAHRNKQLHLSHVNKAKEKYEAEYAKKIAMENQIQTAGFREADRLRQKIERSQNEISTLEKEYKNATLKLADATFIWNQEWKSACDKFQHMEEKRIEFLHHSLCIYVNILSTASTQNQESFERFWRSLDGCNIKTDIEQFIDEKGTGPMIPEPPVYVNYFDDPAKTLPKYQIAQFPAAVAGGSIMNEFEQAAALKRTTSFKEKLPANIASKLLSDERKSQFFSSTRSLGVFKKPAPAKPTTTTSEPPDEPIDPRAQVVLAIGNNTFAVNQEDPPEKKDKQQQRKSNSLRRAVQEEEEDFRQSIRVLLQELGVQPDPETKCLAKKKKPKQLPPQNDQGPPVIAWAQALYDYHSDEPDDLQFSCGAWLGLVRAEEHEDWWIGRLWDDRAGILLNPCGYVARNFVQVRSEMPVQKP